MQELLEHRAAIRQSLSDYNPAPLWRDVAGVRTTWGEIESAAVYVRDASAGWVLVIDEFGDPTDIGLEIYARFRKPSSVGQLVRLANKNQIMLTPQGPTQLSPAKWTARFLELSRLYELLQRFGPLSRSSPSSDHASLVSRLVKLAWGGANREDILHHLAKTSQRLAGLPIQVQALLLVCDSDLGKPAEPFLQVHGADPPSLNHLSGWRCWSPSSDLENVLALLVPPVALGGEDIYRRPVWGPTPGARVRQLCILETSAASVEAPHLHAVNYEVLWEQLRDLVARARGNHDPDVRIAGGVARDLRTGQLLQRARFWLAFWSHHVREALVYGDTRPERVYNVMMEGDGRLAHYRRSTEELWSSTSTFTASTLLSGWATAYCPATDCGGWDPRILGSGE